MGDMFDMISALSAFCPIARLDVVEHLGAWHPSLSKKFAALSKRRPTHCSYGEIRYYFALTLLAQPNELILLDEPTAGVDPEHRYFIWHAIAAAKKAGKTIVVSSHHLQEIADHVDLLWFVNKQQFHRFDSGQAFQRHYGGADLDTAFLNASRAP
ncbi:AAA family ATPase [Pseudomonas sp. DC3000-4b1]|uniref:AAA family ATPase n=1 Tax=unclassified Pseudomonas TaxID=196821 RepID=UPI003CF3AD3E